MQKFWPSERVSSADEGSLEFEENKLKMAKKWIAWIKNLVLNCAHVKLIFGVKSTTGEESEPVW